MTAPLDLGDPEPQEGAVRATNGHWIGSCIDLAEELRLQKAPSLCDASGAREK